MNKNTYTFHHEANKDINPIAFEKRRASFFNALEKSAENVVAIVQANPELIRNHDVHFGFRQDSNFYYLTGFNEPDAIAVFTSIKGKREYTLFVRPKDLAKEIWTGYRAGVEGAVQKYQANRAYPLAEFDTQLLKLFQGSDRIYYGFNRNLNMNGVEYLDQKILRLLNEYRLSLGRTGKSLAPIHDIQEILGELRIYKSAEEIARMRIAGKISAIAHCEAMARCHAGMNEAQIQAIIEYYFRNQGSLQVGYTSIVASGHNATILHYVENNRFMQAEDLLLIDAGAEFDYYTADITRTFPVSGKCNKAQAEIYNIVLAVQKECIKMAKPGVTLRSIHDFAVDELTDAMIKLKFIPASKQQALSSLEYKKYYPHGTGHLLGMDVHDTGLYQINGEPRKLEPGMAFTIEPGFYVLHDDQNVPAHYRGIGVRIEDDVVITKDGCEVLTTDVPKDLDAMQAIIGSKAQLN